VHSAAPIPAATPPPNLPSPRHRRPDPDALLTLVNGVLAGVGGVYATTHSVMVTVIAGVTAAVLTLMVLIFQR
jgi:hypothetical protein